MCEVAAPARQGGLRLRHRRDSCVNVQLSEYSRPHSLNKDRLEGESQVKPCIADAVSRFGKAATAKLSNPAATGEPEDQLRAPFEGLLTTAALRAAGVFTSLDHASQVGMFGE
jgi:hypothetical protein